jgi:predicted ATPase
MLEPLSEAESQQLLASLLGEAELAGATWKRVREAAEGNPLYLEELLAMLIDRGLLRHDQGRWVPTADLSRVTIPPTIQALLSARFEQLEWEEQAVIQRAAVAGKVFYLGAVRDLLEDIHLALVAHLTTLVRKDLVRPVRSDLGDEEAFRFRHILIRDTAYEAIPMAPRAELHERFADWLERKTGNRAKEYEEIVAYHLEMAFRYRDALGLVDEHSRRLARRAAERLIRGGQRAFVRGDIPAAAKLLRRARALLPEDDPARLDLSVKLGEALAKLESFQEAEAILSEVLARAVATGDQGLEAYARIERTFARISTGTAGSMLDALEEGQRAIALFGKLGDEQGLTRAWNLVADVYGNEGRELARQQAFERSLAYTRSTGDEREEAWASWGILAAMAHGPTPVEEVIRYGEAQLQWARARGHRWLEAGALIHLGQVQAMRGRFDEARELIAQSRAICEDLGMEVLAAATSQFSGLLEQLAGDAPAAERELRRGYVALDVLGEKSYLSTVAAQLAHALYAQERYDEAEAFATASNLAAAQDDVTSQVLWRGAQAKVLAQRGAVVQSEQLARESVALADGTDNLNMRAGALLDLTEVLRLTGRTTEAVDHQNQAVRLYERKGNLVAARHERARIQQLRVPGPRARTELHPDRPVFES